MMPARTFSAPTIRPAPPARRPAPARSPARIAPRPIVGVPRFARFNPSPTTSAPPSPAARISAPNPPRLSPPSSTPARRARPAATDSHWEREARRFSARLHERPAPRRDHADALATRADAPTAGASTPSAAHPGLGPSPPLPSGTTARPLPASLRERLEAHTGFDLGAIALIGGPATERSAAMFQARAFTQHGRIHLGPTASPHDARLIAHEVAHALQQTLPVASLARLGLSPAPPDSILCEFDPFSFFGPRSPRDAFNDPFALSYHLLPRSLRDAIAWLDGDSLGVRVTRAVAAALNRTFAPLRQLEGWWQVGQRQVDAFPIRLERWQFIRDQAVRTDDPSLAAALRNLANHFGGFVGVRWTELRDLVVYSAAVAAAGAARWRGGLASIGPDAAAHLDALTSGIDVVFDRFDADAPIVETLRIALGAPSHLHSQPGLAAWIAGIHRQADAEIASLAAPAQHVASAKLLADSLGAIAQQLAVSRALRPDLDAIALIVESPEGFIEQRATLRVLLERVRPQLSAASIALANFSEVPGVVLGGLAGDFQRWGRAPPFAYFPGEFDWMLATPAAVEAWARDQEPAAFELVTETLHGIGRWSGLALETTVETDDLEDIYSPHSKGWRRIFDVMLVLPGSGDRIIKRLIRRVPFLRELIDHAPRLWQKAGSLLGQLKERIQKTRTIVGPLWEFLLGVLSFELPDGFIRDLLERGATIAGKILRHPFRFLGHLIHSIAAGLKNFGANIGNHLLNALLDWLLGEFDLQPPPTIGKIIGAVAQHIGFTLRTVSERIVEYLKSKRRPTTVAAVEKWIDRAIAAGSTALRWLKLLIAGNVAGFWQEIRQHLTDLWRWLVDRAVSYAVDKVKELIPSRLAQFIDPSGIMTIINLVKTLWDAIQTVIRYAQQMFAIVRSVFHAVREIAAGQIDRAAQFVENAAANALSAALGFLARFVGLKSIVDHFKRALDALRRHVVAGIDAVVKFTGGVWEWLYDKAEAAADWWQNRRRFVDAGGAGRTLHYDTSGQSAVLMLSEADTRGQASALGTPRETLGAYLDGLTPANARETELRDEIRNLAGQIDHIKKEAGGSFSAAKGDLINTLFIEIVTLLEELGGRARPPRTEVRWEKKSIYQQPHGKRMVATLLSTDPGEHIGSKPVATDTKLWSKVSGYLRGGDTHYIKGHLLNHHLHGPGTWENMTPIARTTNTQMERVAEGPVKEAVLNHNKVVSYTVDMIYGKHRRKPKSEAEGYLPSQIELSAEELVYKKGKWVPSGNRIFSTPPLENEIR